MTSSTSDAITNAPTPAPTSPDAAVGDEGAISAPTTAADRRPSKSEAVLKLLRRKRGASLAELQAATGWQAHSVRGFLSGTVRKRMKLTLTSEPGSDGVRRYTVAKG